jgi:threonine dehydrogenase-like Zn-dependent dehydrogenase
MKALTFARSVPRYAAARVAGALAPGAGSRVGPLRLVDMDEPALPGPGWHRVRPLLAGICGSDLATVDGRSSRYFEAIVSFPFTPGHEVVGLLDDGRRIVLEPVLGCSARAISPLCPSCASGHTGDCEHIALGQLAPGLQTGYCADSGGGWGAALVAHDSQLHEVPAAMSDEAAVMIEPTACAVHAALAASSTQPGDLSGATVAVLGAGTLGLCTVAALRALALPGTVIVGAKHPEQRAMASDLGATVVVAPSEVQRAVRRATRCMSVGDRLTGGADVVLDCVGSAESLASALAMVRPRGKIVLVGMPGRVSVDLTPLWHREIALVGTYAYGHEPAAGRRSTFALAMDLVAEADLQRLVSAHYPLERYTEAIEHAANAGRRGAVKVVFDLRSRSRDVRMPTTRVQS